MALVDNAVYVDGRRVATPPNLEETFEVMKQQQGCSGIGLDGEIVGLS